MSFFSKVPREDAVNNLTAISRTEIVEGYSIPAIIKNGGYHFIDLQIYRDGLVNCWEMVDLSLFRSKLDSRWVVTSIPNGDTISIFSLGNWIIDNGDWLYDKFSFYDYVYSLVKKLNPNLENLYNCHGTTTKKIGNVNVSIFSEPNPKPYYTPDPNNIFSEKIGGENFNIFFRADDSKIYLADLSIFKNGHVEIANLPRTQFLDFSQIRILIDEEKILSNIPANERIHIFGLGSFITTSGCGVDIESKYRELLDQYNSLNGAISSLENCRQVFAQYKENPTQELKEKLKRAYEAIPEHNRMFVGDMDTKDFEVRIAIYGNIVKDEWKERYGFDYPF